MARTEAQWNKKGTYLLPNDNVPVVVYDYLNFGGLTSSDIGFGIRNNGGVMQFKNSSGAWTNIPAAVGGATWVNEAPVGLVNDSNTSFEITSAPLSGSLFVYLNGQFQRPGIDYTLSTTTISMLFTPAGGTMYVMYQT